MYCSLRKLASMGVEATFEALFHGAFKRLIGGVDVACAEHRASRRPATELVLEQEGEGEHIVCGGSLHRLDSRWHDELWVLDVDELWVLDVDDWLYELWPKLAKILQNSSWN
jgi:hypothetical protein